jgi:3-oxoacyl-[acyl-carrier protein] reductase
VEISTYLITGASGGIGSVLCQRLAQSGHRLVLAARDLDRLSSLQRSLPGDGHQAIPVDMASDASIEMFSKQLADLGVSLDGAVLMPPQPHAANDPLPDSEVWRTLFQTSFIGPLATLKAAISRMQPDVAAGQRAKIVIVSGLSSAQVLGHYATSNVIRTAWLGEAKTLAFALGARNIHVNTLSLGGTLTPGYRDSIARRAAAAGQSFEDRLAAETDNVPLRKYGEPAEVAAAVEGLLSPFSDHMTGLNVLHDGGFTRAY